MRKFLVLVFLTAGLGWSSGCIHVSRSTGWEESDSNYRHNGSSDRSHEARSESRGDIPSGVSLLEAENAFGSISVTGSDSGLAEWSWKCTARASSDLLASNAVAAAACRPEWDGRRLRLIVNLPDYRETSFHSDLIIRVPRLVSVHTRNSFGASTLSDLASVDVQNQHGSIVVRNVPGTVRAGTAFGLLEVSKVGTASLKNQHGAVNASEVRGDLTAETSFGHLTAEQVGGSARLNNQHGAIKGTGILGSVDAETSFGALDIAASGPKLACRNQHGPVTLSALSLEFVDIQATTAFAAMKIVLPSGTDPAVSARTSFGEIDSDFAIFMKPAGQDALAAAAPNQPRVSLVNQHGSIEIRRR